MQMHSRAADRFFLFRKRGAQNGVSCRLHLVETADRGIVRRGVERFGVLMRKAGKRTEDLDCLVHGGLGFRFRRLDHERLVDDQWEIHCGRMNTVVKQTLGDIERGNAGLDILQRGHHIIRI